MLVIDDAARLIEHLPAALPGQVAEVGVFQIERARAADRSRPARETSRGRTRRSRRRRRSRDRGRRSASSMRCRTRRPPSSHQPCVRPVSSRRLAGIAEKDLAGDGEDFVVGEAVEQRREEIGLDAHVAVQQHDDVVPRGAKAGVRSAAEAEILSAAPRPSPAGKCSRRNSALPSVEPLSTTMISFSGLPASAVDRPTEGTSPAGRGRSSWGSRRVARRMVARRSRPARVPAGALRKAGPYSASGQQG